MKIEPFNLSTKLKNTKLLESLLSPSVLPSAPKSTHLDFFNKPYTDNPSQKEKRILEHIKWQRNFKDATEKQPVEVFTPKFPRSVSPLKPANKLKIEDDVLVDLSLQEKQLLLSLERLEQVCLKQKGKLQELSRKTDKMEQNIILQPSLSRPKTPPTPPQQQNRTPQFPKEFETETELLEIISQDLPMAEY